MLSRKTLVFAGGVVAMATAAACSSISNDETARDPGAEGGTDALPELPDGPSEGAAEPRDSSAKVDADVLASGFTTLAGVAATETTVYFVEREPGNVRAVPLMGGPVTDLRKDPATRPDAVVVAGTSLYWSDSTNNTIARTPLDSLDVVSATPTPTKRPVAMIASQSGIVVVAHGAGTIGEIQQYGFDLTAGPSIADFTNPADVAVSGGEVFWTESGGGGAVWRGELGQPTKEQLAPGELVSESIAADTLGVYWTAQSSKVRARLAQGTGAPITLGNSEAKPLSLASDDSGVYWLTVEGKLRRSSRAAELPPTTIAKDFAASFGGAHVQAIALTSKFVVWITSDGQVLRRAK